MIEESSLVVYKASAGSGKTFNLVLEYVFLLINNPKAYKNILAVTFTNKATKQMKQRILFELYSIASKKDSSFFKALVDKIKESNKENEEKKIEDKIREKAKEALTNIIHDYSYFNIMTIDAFLQKVMRTLSKELGVGTNYNLLIDQKEIIEKAIDKLIEKTGEDKELLSWYIKILDEKIEEGNNVNIEKTLIEFSENLEKETFKTLEKEIKQISIEDFSSFKKEGKRKEKEIIDNFQMFSDEFANKISSENLMVEDFIYGEKGIGGAILSLPNNIKDGSQTKSFNEKPRVLKAIESSQNWFSKKNATENNISLVETYLLPLLNRIIKYYNDNMPLLKAYRATLPYIDNIKLLQDIAKYRDDISKDENVFLLSSTSKLLSDIIQNDNNSDISFIYEKIGTTYSNIMIDEFQDTSILNWKTLSQLVKESIDNGNKSIIVGDVKQSIYRWRNGDWNILNNIEEELKYDNVFNQRRLINTKELNTNYRTMGNIVEFNNSIFSKSVCDFAETTSLLLDEQREKLKNIFSNSKQDVPLSAKDKGEVRCFFVKGNNQKDYIDNIKARLKNEIDYYLNDLGYNPFDISILFRRKNYLKDFALFLSEQGYKVISDEAFLFNSSQAINLIIDGLKFIDNNNNTISKYRLEQYIEKNKLDLSLLKNTIALREKSLFDTILFIINSLSLEKEKDQEAFITGFLDEVSLFLQRNTADIPALLIYWEDVLKDKTISISENSNAIRLITIHKAKGLEYPIVIIPEINWDITKTSDKLWIENKELPISKQEGVNTISALYTKLSDIKNSVFNDNYQKEIFQQVVDNINVLYVALTRPKNALSIIGVINEKVASSFDIEEIKNVSQLLYKGVVDNKLLSEKTIYGENELFFWNNVSQKKEDYKKEEESKKKEENIFDVNLKPIDVSLHFSNKNIRYAQTKMAEQFLKTLSEDDDESKKKEDNKRTKGIVFHNILSNIHTKDDIIKAVDIAINGGEIKKNERKEYLEKIENILCCAEKYNWFSNKYEILNEIDIVFMEKDAKDNEDKVVVKRPDRIIMDKENNEVIIIDYKFTNFYSLSQNNKEQIKKYEKQILQYKSLINSMGYKNVKAYLWFIDFAYEEYSKILSV
ncbi:MAG: UvrD-helicase domain-containing protein [Bacteroidales bacterium]|jgi:ATP-dependent exoDNAse (exonuclease V) beta subunit|nr:UvrD-helicase domain-containing protein [Bacteroidales bacterium]